MTKPRILVFEGDARINESIRAVLVEAGYAVSQAFDLASAWKAFNSDPPDFALLDMSAQLLEEPDLTQALVRSQVPFILSSMRDDPGLIRLAVDMGAIGCFLKPFDVSVIVPSIRAWLARAAELQQLGQDQRCLQEAVHSNRSIGTAVGMIMERHQLTQDRAFEALRRQARNERTSVLHLSSRIVAGIVALQPAAGVLKPAAGVDVKQGRVESSQRMARHSGADGG